MFRGLPWNSHLFPAFGGFPSRGAGSSAKGNFPPDRTCINGKIHGIMDFDLQNDGEMRMTTWYLKYLEVSWSSRDWARVEQISVWMQIWWCFNHPFMTVLSPGFSHGRRCLLPKKKGTAHRAPVTQPQPSAMEIRIWLVVYLPLLKLWKSVGITIPNIWKVIKFMFQTTNQASFHPNPIDKLQPHSTVPVVRCGLP